MPCKQPGLQGARLLHIVRGLGGRLQEHQPVLLGKLLALLRGYRTPVLRTVNSLR